MSGVSTLYTVGLALCLFSGGILNARTRRAGEPVSYFAWYFALEGTCFLFEILLTLEATPFKALWLSLLMVNALLIAPALWLALQEATGPRPALASVGARQRVLIVSGVVLTMPLLATTHAGNGFVDPDRMGGTFLEPIIHETMVGCLVLFAIQVPLYLYRCRGLLTHTDPGSTQRWLQIPLAIVGTTWVLGVFRTALGVWSAGSEELFAALAFIDVGVTTACVYFMIRTIAAPGSAGAAASDVRAGIGEASRPSKYAKSQLDPHVRARIRRKLDAAFRIDYIHRDCDLKLAALSRALNESEHYVSQVINQDLDTTFYELVNRHRIEQAKQLLQRSPELNVLEVAMAVGFNAKSTFNNAFRRLTGMTPREYRAARVHAPADGLTGDNG
jgi:AraC-like DNA-binding protein